MKRNLNKMSKILLAFFLLVPIVFYHEKEAKADVINETTFIAGSKDSISIPYGKWTTTASFASNTGFDYYKLTGIGSFRATYNDSYGYRGTVRIRIIDIDNSNRVLYLREYPISSNIIFDLRDFSFTFPKSVKRFSIQVWQEIETLYSGGPGWEQLSSITVNRRYQNADYNRFIITQADELTMELLHGANLSEKLNELFSSIMEVSNASNTNVITKTIDGKHYVDLQRTFNNVFSEIGKTAKLTDLNNLENRLNKNITDFQNQINASLANLEGNIDNRLNNLQKNIDNLSSEINNIGDQITNIQGLFPPTLSKVSGYNNATATTTGSFRVVLDYSNATQYRYRVGSGSWSGWSPISDDGTFTASGLSSGANTIHVEIRNSEEGLVSRGKITVFRVN